MTEPTPTYITANPDSDDATIANCTFKFKCDQDWETMTRTAVDGVRHCGECDKDVFSCTSIEDVAKHARLGHCIAIVPTSGSRLLGYVVRSD